MPSPDRLRVLAKEVEANLKHADRLAQDLAAARARFPKAPSQEQLVYAGYLLHGIYTSWESAFHRIATTFENRLDPSRWHSHLLDRMALDIPGIRPAVIDPTALPLLHRLRAFRHFFRHNYAAPMDFDEVQLVLSRYDAATLHISSHLQGFLRIVDRMSDESEQADTSSEGQE